MTTASSTKRALEDVSNKKPATKEGPAKKARNGANDEAKIEKAANGVIRKIQGQINSKLKWRNGFRDMKHGYRTKGGRVQVACNDPRVFERIFASTTSKKGKDGKLSCSYKTDDDIYGFHFHGKSYRYNRSTLHAPCSASLKEGELTFSFKFSID